MVRRKSRSPSRPWAGIFLVFAATVVTILFFVCSISVGKLPDVATHSAAPLSVEPAATFLMQLNFWYAALYVILALATVICGLLFIASSHSDGPLSFERSGGGLGAGSGGWEVSNSLTYLIATIALSTLLLALIFHNDTMDREREKRREDAAHKASAPANVTSPSTQGGSKPETGNTVPAAAHPGGAESSGH